MIFYKQDNDTTVSQRIVERVLARFGLELSGVDHTFNSSELTYVLGESVKNDELIFVVGGLERAGADNITRVLGQALSVPVEEAGLSRSKYILDKAHGLPAPTLAGSEIILSRMGGPDGFVLNSGIQCIMGLPDVHAQLSDMLAGSGAAYFARFYGLTELEMLSRGADDVMVEIRPGELTSILETTLNLSDAGRNYKNNFS
ncbi:MAG: hypothetical protein IJL87_10500, partial [Clostridia bacterium]|nr:hypothetical protein [Clostridia bacterium]